MYEVNQLAGKGLKLLFFAELLLAVSVVLAGLLKSGLELAALVLSLTGLHRAAASHPLFRRAFHLTIAQVVIYILAALLTVLGSGGLRAASIFTMLLSAAVLVLQFYVVYLICMTAGELLTAGGFDAEAARGRTAWKFCLADTAISLLAVALFVLPALVPSIAPWLMWSEGATGLMLALALVMGIVRLAYFIIYLMFLYHAYLALLRGD